MPRYFTIDAEDEDYLPMRGRTGLMMWNEAARTGLRMRDNGYRNIRVTDIETFVTVELDEFLKSPPREL